MLPLPSTRPCLLPCALLLLGQLLFAGCGSDAEYVAEVDAWHAQRLERLRSDTGWLTLVGLHSLMSGPNTLGAAAGNDIVMTPGPPSLGTLTLTAGRLEFAPHPGAEVHLFRQDRPAAEPFGGGVIAADSQDGPDELSCGSLVFHVIQRGERFFLRVKDRQSPVLLGFSGIDRYPVDRSWRVVARLEGTPGTVPVVNVLGQTSAEPSPGTLVFELAGVTCRLDPTGAPGAGLFVVFADDTNGLGTYPGGRFLVTDPPADDGTVVLDFNRAYNPPCVFTEFATCPLPGPTNRLPVAVTAGEKMWGTGH